MAMAVGLCGGGAAAEGAREPELSIAAQAEQRGLESGHRALAAIVQLSPLLGLMGTVTGMIATFSRMEGAGRAVSPALLAGGIWEALLTTAMGLAVAIPARAALYWLEGEADRHATKMVDGANRSLAACGQPRRVAPSDTDLAHASEGGDR